MKRSFHGCEIESLPGCIAEGSDGWSHTVRRDGQVIGEFVTLGLAIAAAKALHKIQANLPRDEVAQAPVQPQEPEPQDSAVPLGQSEESEEPRDETVAIDSKQEPDEPKEDAPVVDHAPAETKPPVDQEPDPFHLGDTK